MKPQFFASLGLILIFYFPGQNAGGQTIGLVDIRQSEQVITVGGPKADVAGFTSEATQLALDAVKARGGGASGSKSERPHEI
jgi:hypothetical protein